MLESKQNRISFEGPPCLDYRTISCRLLLLMGLTMIIPFILSFLLKTPEKLIVPFVFAYAFFLIIVYMLVYHARTKYLVDTASGNITVFIFKLFPRIVAKTTEVRLVLLETEKGGLGEMKVLLQPELEKARMEASKDKEKTNPVEGEDTTPADIVEVRRKVSLELMDGRRIRVSDTAVLSDANSIAENICRLLNVRLHDASENVVNLDDDLQHGTPLKGEELRPSEVQVPFYRKPQFVQPYGEILPQKEAIPHEIKREENSFTVIFQVQPAYKKKSTSALYRTLQKVFPETLARVPIWFDEYAQTILLCGFLTTVASVIFGLYLGFISSRNPWPIIAFALLFAGTLFMSWLARAFQTRPFSIEVSRDRMKIEAEGKKSEEFALDEILDLESLMFVDKSSLIIRTAGREYTLVTTMPYKTLTTLCEDIRNFVITIKEKDTQQE